LIERGGPTARLGLGVRKSKENRTETWRANGKLIIIIITESKKEDGHRLHVSL
jgi:hypothetical protein